MTRRCTAYWCTEQHPCRRCRDAKQARAQQTHRSWFERTGHCGACGQPGDWCQCTDTAPCGCRDLHQLGSGIDRDPADLFTTRPTDHQGELFA